MLKVLEKIYAEKSDKEVKADMWCHFGHAYITKVDEGEYVNLIFGAVTLFAIKSFFFLHAFFWRSLVVL